MTIEQLKIELELNAGDTASILEKHASHIIAEKHHGSYVKRIFIFIDDEDGQSYLFDKNGRLEKNGQKLNNLL